MCAAAVPLRSPSVGEEMCQNGGAAAPLPAPPVPLHLPSPPGNYPPWLCHHTESFLVPPFWQPSAEIKEILFTSQRFSISYSFLLPFTQFPLSAFPFFNNSFFSTAIKLSQKILTPGLFPWCLAWCITSTINMQREVFKSIKRNPWVKLTFKNLPDSLIYNNLNFFYKYLAFSNLVIQLKHLTHVCNSSVPPTKRSCHLWVTITAPQHYITVPPGTENMRRAILDLPHAEAKLKWGSS